MKPARPPALRGDATREALIAAAIDIFGSDGFHAASTRTIAVRAGANQALIGYHFRNKEGLYLAVFEYIVEQIRTQLEPVVDAVEAVFDLPDDADRPEARHSRYLPPLLRLMDGFVALMAREQMTVWAKLILREQQAPTDAFVVLYEGFMERLLTLLTRLVQQLKGYRDIAEARLLVVTLLGQVLVFRAAHAGVLRHMGWAAISETELAAIQARVRKNVTALLLAPE